MPDIKTYDIASWPADWRKNGEESKANILANPSLGVNSPEYHEYMNYCQALIIYEQEMKDE